MNSLPHIRVCVCTYRRRDLLRELLQALSVQETDGRFTFSIRVVDNDRERSAGTTVDGVKSAMSVDIEYHCEPRQNIALARNLAVSGLSSAFVAMIDDDEVPERDWLLRLHQALSESGADGVLGPVRPSYPEGCPEWLRQSGICDRPEFPTGQELKLGQGRTGNVLFRAALFSSGTALFDERFGLSGGEDSDFFLRQMNSGRRFIWCREAAVSERVPENRWALSYYVRRQFRGGALDGERDRWRGPFVRSALAAGVHFVRVLLLLPFGRRAYAGPLVSMASRWGYFTAAMGYRFRRRRDEMGAGDLGRRAAVSFLDSGFRDGDSSTRRPDHVDASSA